ncbi:MAG TPA: adenosine kinase [Methylomirabilota bacterium]|nr:adenosine kinase [Methylomirabilota bacterium]
MAPDELDVVGVGNALVDVLCQESDAFLERHGLVKGTMHLVDEARARAVYAAMGPGVEISGGSAANTIVGVASFGGRAHYVGKVRDDQLGEVFSHDLRATGVSYTTPPATSGPSTGRCLIVVTPDAQRTMNTYLGASVQLGPADVDARLIARGRLLYLEGYLFDPPAAQEAFRVAADLAHGAGRKVALTLSDPFCVDRHRAAFQELVERHVDVVFANEAEICSLYQVNDFDSALQRVRRHCEIAALTRSERGSVVLRGDEMHVIDAQPIDAVVDTTGAGDLYAAGFLFGLSRGMSLATCGRLGSLAAAEVISHVGARPVAPLGELAEALLA